MNLNYKLWTDSKESLPTFYIHSFVGDGKDVWEACHTLNCPPFNLVSIYDFESDADLTPWQAENVWKNQPPFKGEAYQHLKGLINELIPEVESKLSSPSASLNMVGYSLAGLFTLWSCFQTNIFSRIGCVSASFWYPDFMDYLNKTNLVANPLALYFSLGDKESKTKHPLMKQVEECTQQVIRYFHEQGIPTTYEINPGNHFQEADKRTARAIQWLLMQE